MKLENGTISYDIKKTATVAVFFIQVISFILFSRNPDPENQN